MRSILTLLFCLAAISSPTWSQTSEQKAIQTAISNKTFSDHVKMQILFDLSEKMFYQLPGGMESTVKELEFLDKPLSKAVVLPDDPIELVNFSIKKAQIRGKKARVKFNFYPFWKICNDDEPSASYSNGLYLSLDVRMTLVDENWQVNEVKVEDIDFSWSQGAPGYGCLKRHYIPF